MKWYDQKQKKKKTENQTLHHKKIKLKFFSVGFVRTSILKSAKPPPQKKKKQQKNNKKKRKNHTQKK